MKTKIITNRTKLLNLLIALSLSVGLILSCASGKKTASSGAASPSTATSETPSAANADTGKEEIPFVVVEEMPLFPGGDSMLLDFIARNARYPEGAKAKKIEGKVILRFCVTEKGTVNKISILRSVDPELDAEAMRVTSILPVFKPGRQGGRDVPVWYMIPVTFALN